MSSPTPTPTPAAAAPTSPSGPSPPASPTIPDRPSSPFDLPLTMTASTVLAALPRDATAALAAATSPPFASAAAAATFDGARKVVVRFKPVGGAAPAIRPELRKISATQRFEAVVAYLRRILKVREEESVFLYVNSTFAPALDEIVGNLHQCFKDSNDQLNVSYSLTPAFG